MSDNRVSGKRACASCSSASKSDVKSATGTSSNTMSTKDLPKLDLTTEANIQQTVNQVSQK